MNSLTFYRSSYPDLCELVPKVPYAPCEELAKFRCAACCAHTCVKHTILHGQEADLYKVGFICSNCSEEAQAPKAEAVITDAYNDKKFYLAFPDCVQLQSVGYK